MGHFPGGLSLGDIINSPKSTVYGKFGFPFLLYDLKTLIWYSTKKNSKEPKVSLIKIRIKDCLIDYLDKLTENTNLIKGY